MFPTLYPIFDFDSPHKNIEIILSNYLIKRTGATSLLSAMVSGLSGIVDGMISEVALITH